MNKEYIIDSEKDIKDDLSQKFKLNRYFEQKAFYLSDTGANNYYNLNIASKPHVKASFDINKNYEFLKRIFLKKKTKLALISLGCGNSVREKEMLIKAYNEGYDFTYFGIDSSRSMINLARKELEDCKFGKKFICADFSSKKFRKKLRELFEENSSKIFLFMGNTIGNVPQSYIADTVRNMLKKEDMLWLDVSIREDTSDVTAGKIFERYMNYLKDPAWQKYTYFPLEELKVPFKNGELVVSMTKETSLNALNFKFGFKVLKTTEVNIENEFVILLPGDVINLIEIRVYDLKSLISFFELRHFKIVDKLVIHNKAQIILKKIDN